LFNSVFYLGYSATLGNTSLFDYIGYISTVSEARGKFACFSHRYVLSAALFLLFKSSNQSINYEKVVDSKRSFSFKLSCSSADIVSHAFTVQFSSRSSVKGKLQPKVYDGSCGSPPSYCVTNFNRSSDFQRGLDSPNLSARGYHAAFYSNWFFDCFTLVFLQLVLAGTGGSVWALLLALVLNELLKNKRLMLLCHSCLRLLRTLVYYSANFILLILPIRCRFSLSLKTLPLRKEENADLNMRAELFMLNDMLNGDKYIASQRWYLDSCANVHVNKERGLFVFIRGFKTLFSTAGGEVRAFH